MPLSFRSFRLAAVLASASLGLSLSAHATPLPFNLQLDVLGDGTQLTGSFFEDNSTGQVTGSLVFVDGANTYTFLGTDLLGTGGNGSYSYSTFVNSNGDTLNFNFFPAQTVTGPLTFTEALCSLAVPCERFSSPVYANLVPSGGSAVNVADGYVLFTFVPLAAAPEPSSFALLGTGLLGAFGVARRRFLHS